MKIKNVCGHSFVLDFLRLESVILDCGANEGAFARWFDNNHKDAIVYGFEPDPRLFPLLPEFKNVIFLQLAVSNDNKKIKLHLGELRNSSAYFEETLEQNHVWADSVSLDKFSEEKSLQYIDLIKLDVEGAEIDILEDLDGVFFESVGQITVEFHDFLDHNEVRKIRQIMKDMRARGFVCIKFSHHDYSDVLMINSNLYSLSLVDIFILFALKYVRGFSRILKRILA